jgi:putative peptidoglycan lipid II flippase
VSQRLASAPRPHPAPEGDGARGDRRLARAAVLVAVLSGLGALLGFVRDLLIAQYFGASAGTDAFVVAWTIPETATPLLMEGTMSALLVPLFSHELTRTGSFKAAFGSLLLPLVAALSIVTAVVVLAAPLLVSVLAPGLADSATAVRSVRVAALTILLLGLAGYLMAALRARDVFGWAGAVYVAYNIGIIVTLVALHERLGVFSAALGLAVGGACMVAIQVPAALRFVGVPRPTLRLPPDLVVRLAPFIPLALYTLGRHGQVYVERFLGSLLSVGTISELNYATKVAQIPMMLSLTVAMVTFPTLSRAAASGASERLLSLVVRNLRLVAFLIVPATAFLVVFAPEMVEVLFRRGAFTEADSASTARILQAYALGLLGQVLVGICVQALVAVPGRTWQPARAAGLGLLVTAVVASLGAALLGARGIALANAIGISVMALLLLRALPRRGIAISTRAGVAYLGRCVVATVVAAAIALGVATVVASWAPASGRTSALVTVIVGGVALGAMYLATGRALRIGEAMSAVQLAGDRARRLLGHSR